MWSLGDSIIVTSKTYTARAFAAIKSRFTKPNGREKTTTTAMMIIIIIRKIYILNNNKINNKGNE